MARPDVEPLQPAGTSEEGTPPEAAVMTPGAAADSPRAAAARARTYTHLGQQSPLAGRGKSTPPEPGGDWPAGDGEEKEGELTPAELTACCPGLSKTLTLRKQSDGHFGMGFVGGVIGFVAHDSFAAEAGFQVGHRIIAVGGAPLDGDEEGADTLITRLISEADGEIDLTVEHELELSYNDLFHHCAATGVRPAQRVNLGNMQGYTIEAGIEYAMKHPEHAVAVSSDISDYGECFWNYRFNRWCTADESDAFERVLEALFHSKGSFLDDPIAAKQSSSGSGNGYRFGTTTMQGWRVDNEDDHVAVASLEGMPSCGLFAVLDGHGGQRVAKFAGPRLAGCVTRHLPADLGDGTRDALYAATLDLDALVESNMKSDHNGTTGTTLNAVLITPRNIFTSNVGDSRAVLQRKQECVPLSSDHKPTDASERERIQKAGSQVCDGRIDGMLAVSRAIGDFEFKQASALPPERQVVSCAPDVTMFERMPDDEFVLQACDGIWDCLSSEAACTFIRKQLASGATPAAAVEALCDSCLASELEEHGIGSDNMTVNLVVFD